MAVVRYRDEDWYVVPWHGFSKAFEQVAKSNGYKDGWLAFWNHEVHPWMIENLQGQWFWGGFDGSPLRGYYFELQSDALLFKLIWHIDQHNPTIPLICSGKRFDP